MQCALTINDDLCNGRGVERRLAGSSCVIGRQTRLIRALREHEQALAQIGAGELDRNPSFEIDWRKRPSLGQHRFGTTEEQHAAVIEREMESGEDARLRLGVEVHERVARYEEIDARDRRVLDE